MSVAEWTIATPYDSSSHYSWTPEEVAQIARAVQAFQAALPTAGGRLVHLVRLDGIGILDPAINVDWPQPGEPVVFGPVPCSICGELIRVDNVHVHPDPRLATSPQ